MTACAPSPSPTELYAAPLLLWMYLSLTQCLYVSGIGAPFGG
jgi:hypothetical protein